MGEPDTFGNNEAKKPQMSLAQLLSITTSGPDQFIMLRNLGSAIVMSEMMKTERMTEEWNQ